MKSCKNIEFGDVEILDGFWEKRYSVNANTSIYSVQNRFEQTDRFDAIRCKTGCKTHVFYDSDVAKWIDAVAYLLVKNRQKYADLEEFCDELIHCMTIN